MKFFNATELLQSYGYNTSVLEIMSHWDLSGYTRVSDIIRLALAHKYLKTYIDIDILFLELSNKTIFMKSFVSACIWRDIEASIEITNSAFCLNRDVLQEMMEFQIHRILTNNSFYFYTELGIYS